MNTQTTKHNQKKARIRKKLRHRSVYPRLTVFRSNLATYTQLIDDTKGITIASASTKEIKTATKEKAATPIKVAFKVGELIAEKAIKHKITQAVFDRGAYKYHGRIKAIAEGARSRGLKV
jgi:large subunit ribosomal protein L18